MDAMFKTVVLAMDGPGSEPALPVVRELADRFLSNVVIVHVAEIVPGRGSLSVRPDERRIQERLRKLLAQLHSEGINATLDLHSAVRGRAARIISESAERHDADLIVVATRGHSPVLGVLTGSVTQRLLHSAPCPVLAVPAATSDIIVQEEATAA
jgi:nucleotide-binding universal stress UspA family protein